jgi:hypothetical protein
MELLEMVTWKVGPRGDMTTLQVPPFWHLRPPVLHGFLYWQYSPT